MRSTWFSIVLFPFFELQIDLLILSIWIFLRSYVFHQGRSLLLEWSRCRRTCIDALVVSKCACDARTGTFGYRHVAARSCLGFGALGDADHTAHDATAFHTLAS